MTLKNHFSITKGSLLFFFQFCIYLMNQYNFWCFLPPGSRSRRHFFMRIQIRNTALKVVIAQTFLLQVWWRQRYQKGAAYTVQLLQPRCSLPQDSHMKHHQKNAFFKCQIPTYQPAYDRCSTGEIPQCIEVLRQKLTSCWHIYSLLHCDCWKS